VADSDAKIIQRTFAAFNDGGTEALIAHLPPDFVLTTPSELASEPGTYEGHDGIRRYFDSFYEAMDEIRIEPYAFHEAGDWTVARLLVSFRGRSSGIQSEQRVVASVKVADGKATEMTFHPTLEEATATYGA
jgi:ketosteroid isomerase-like protein